MLKNYLTVAIRNLIRHKVYAFINILGLAIGIAFCMLAFLYVRHEWTYDTFHEKADRICRVVAIRKNPAGEQDRTAMQPIPLAPALQDAFPEIVHASRFFQSSGVVHYGSKSFQERLLFADPSVFRIFSFPLLKGSPGSALQDPASVVLSEKMAEKYFGDSDPLGKSIAIRLEGEFQDFIVRGIAREIPENSTIRFDILLSYEKRKESPWGRRYSTSWGARNAITYVLLDGNTRPTDLEAQLPRLVENWFGPVLERGRKRGAYSEDPDAIALRLQPLFDVHMSRLAVSTFEPRGNPAFTYILSGIALSVLLIACVNFVNLSIGLSSTRAREIGVRKVVGASVSSIVSLLSGEYVRLVIAGNILAWPIAYYAMDRWLRDYAYRIRIGPETFLLAGVLSLVIVLLTVVSQAVRAAMANPVDALRNGD